MREATKTRLIDAATIGNVEALSNLAQSDKIDFAFDNNLLLRTAINNFHQKLVEFLIEQPAVLQHEIDNDFPALRLAISKRAYSSILIARAIATFNEAALSYDLIAQITKIKQIGAIISKDGTVRSNSAISFVDFKGVKFRSPFASAETEQSNCCLPFFRPRPQG